MSLSNRDLGRLLDAARPQPGEGAFERYELRDELGRGGMGVVYEAWDNDLDRIVALKLLSGTAGLSEEARARFVREARAAARLSHPNIAAVFDASPEAIVMQRIDGQTLDEAPVKDQRKLATLFRDAALAVHYAHGQGVVHRDLKPANLIVEEGPPPRIVVTDFGLAKEMRVETNLSSTGAVLGTPSYMAPEQARGEPADARSDVYSLGATLFSVLSGRPPFEDKDVYRLVQRVAEEHAPVLSKIDGRIPRDLSTVVGKALEREPSRRYQTALALASDLDRWLHGLPVEARPMSAIYRARRFVSRRQGAVIGALAAAVLVALLLVPLWLTSRADRVRAEREQELTEEALALSDFVAATFQNVRTFRDSGYEPRARAALNDAIARCEAFLSERAEVGRVYDFLARLKQRAGDPEGARAAFDRALELDPDLATVRVDRGVLLALRHGDHAAREDLPPDQLSALRNSALDDLAAITEAGAGLTPEEILFAIAMRHFLRSDYDEAERALLQVVETDDLHLGAHLTLSRLYVATNRDDQALHFGVKVADLMNGQRPTYRSIRKVGHVDGAGPPVALRVVPGLDELVHDFRRARDTHPTESHGAAASASDSLEQAVADMRDGARGRALASLGAAILDLERAIRIEERPEYRIERGVCHALRARILDAASRRGEATLAARAASEEFERAAETTPDAPALRFARGLAQLRRATTLALEGSTRRASTAAESATADLDAAERLLEADTALGAHVRNVRRTE